MNSKEAIFNKVKKLDILEIADLQKNYFMSIEIDGDNFLFKLTWTRSIYLKKYGEAI